MRHRFALLAGFAGACLGTSQPASAQGTIAYYRPETPIPMFTRGFPEQYALDMDGDASTDFTFTYSFSFLGVRSESANRILILLSPPPNVGGPVVPLSAGFSIASDSGSSGLAWSARSSLDPFETLSQCFDSGCGGAFVGQHAYMGVEFERSGSTYYGWVLLNVAPDYPAGTIEAWAWETRPGEPILAGAVPEPSTRALLAKGGFLFCWYGRKKRMA